MLCHVYFFFFKQKTAYEMRISDWSSDVCSSDLQAGRWPGPLRLGRPAPRPAGPGAADRDLPGGGGLDLRRDRDTHGGRIARRRRLAGARRLDPPPLDRDAARPPRGTDEEAPDGEAVHRRGRVSHHRVGEG